MDAQEFKRRFLPHHKVLYRVAYHLTGNAQDAEDLVQDLYLRLWTKRDMMDCEQRQTQAYLVTMIRNLHFNKMRAKRPPIINKVLIDDPPDDTTPETQLMADDNSDQLRTMIDQLPQREREVITLLTADHLNYREMAEATGMSQGNIRIIVMRAKQKLKREFENISKVWKS